MGMTFRELEKIILKDGWVLKRANGSHHQYKHPEKKGKVTIPRHNGDLDKRTVESVLRQAGIENR